MPEATPPTWAAVGKLNMSKYGPTWVTGFEEKASWLPTTDHTGVVRSMAAWASNTAAWYCASVPVT